jgi:Uncharacterized protein conserved in bacteria (DUF2332)
MTMAAEWPRTTRDWYLDFAQEAHGNSPAYERLSGAVADDPELIDILDKLPEPKRQPNLLFAAVRYLGGPVEDPEPFREFVLTRWDEVSEVMRHRRTQTNEAGRCAVLLPVLARLPQPLALLEVGASAGLCLYPDRYGYRYSDGHACGAESPVQLECAVTGPVPWPHALPTVVWRAGLDLNPLDVSDDDDVRWLEALVWPEQEHRRERLRAAAAIARAEPPLLVRGDLLEDLPALAAQAPADVTLVVFHSSTVTYAPDTVRAQFVELVTGLRGHWVSNEGRRVFKNFAVPDIEPGPGLFGLLSLDGRPLGYTAGHGQALHWFAG